MKAIKAETQEKQIKVLEILELDGYSWCLGRKPTDYVPYERNGPEFNYITIDEDKKILKTATKLYPGQEEIPYQQFISKKKKGNTMKVVRAETREEQIKVLKILELNGYKWKDGQAPTKYIPYDRSRELGLESPYLCMDETKKIITASNRPYTEEEILYEQFISRHRKVIL